MQLQCFGLESAHLLVHLESASMTLLRVSHSYLSSSHYVLEDLATALLCYSIILNKLITLERSGRRGSSPIYYLPLRIPEPLCGTISNFQFALSLLLSKVNNINRQLLICFLLFPCYLSFIIDELHNVQNYKFWFRWTRIQKFCGETRCIYTILL